MYIAHDRDTDGHRVVWPAEKSREREFILVLMPGGSGHDHQTIDYSHLGFALESREAVGALAEKVRAHVCAEVTANGASISIGGMVMRWMSKSWTTTEAQEMAR